MKRPQPGPSEFEQRSLRKGDLVQIRNRLGEVVGQAFVNVAVNDEYFVGPVGRAVRCFVTPIDDTFGETLDTWVYRHDRIPNKKAKNKGVK